MTMLPLVSFGDDFKPFWASGLGLGLGFCSKKTNTSRIDFGISDLFQKPVNCMFNINELEREKVMLTLPGSS